MIDTLKLPKKRFKIFKYWIIYLFKAKLIRILTDKMFQIWNILGIYKYKVILFQSFNQILEVDFIE